MIRNMPTLRDLASTIRSKNAGVDHITFDLIFRDRANFEDLLYQNERQPVGARARPPGRPAAARVGERHRPCSGYRFRHAPSMASSSRTAPPGAPAAASGHREAADHTDFRPIANRLCTFSHTSGNGGQEQRK